MFSDASTADDVVEIRLSADVDESRGYCLDIAGGQGAQAPVERGLQAHTCYDYMGELLEDQAFDASLMEQQQFKISYFDVCMTSSSLEEGASLMLEACDGSEGQSFSLIDNGHIVLTANPELCVTVSRTEKKVAAAAQCMS